MRFWEESGIRGRGSRRAGAGRVPAAAVAGLQSGVAAGLLGIPVLPSVRASHRPSLGLKSGASGQDEGKVGRCLCNGTATLRGPAGLGGSEPRGGGCLRQEGSQPRRGARAGRSTQDNQVLWERKHE